MILILSYQQKIIDELHILAKNELQKINKWMITNRLRINLSKSVYILVSSSKNSKI